jgi:hypothetical protein
MLLGLTTEDVMLNQRNRARWVTILLVAMVYIMAGAKAFGFNYAATASDTDMLFDLYSFVHSATTGAPAYVICLLGVCWAGQRFWMSAGGGYFRMDIVGSIFIIAAVIFFIKADSILSSMGYTFS